VYDCADLAHSLNQQTMTIILGNFKMRLLLGVALSSLLVLTACSKEEAAAPEQAVEMTAPAAEVAAPVAEEAAPVAEEAAPVAEEMAPAAEEAAPVAEEAAPAAEEAPVEAPAAQ
jgi:type IV secretory pathway VirB10-like protein